MSLQRRSSHSGGCLFILLTVVILMVCSAPIFERNEKLVANSPEDRHVIHSIRLNDPAEPSDFNSETYQYKLDRSKQVPTHLDDSLEEDKINTRKKKHAKNRPPGRRLRKLVKRSEEKEEEKSEEKELERRSKEEVDESSVDKDDENEEEKDKTKREEKDEDKEDGDDDWGVKFGVSPVESESNSQEAEKNGISPVKGPYLNQTSGSDDKLGSGSDGENLGKPHDHSHTFRNWEEYLQVQKDVIRKTGSNKPAEGRSDQRESFRKPAYRPVIHSDDHFRFVDKLFKAKNDKVKAFHALVLYMKQQGKSFKIPQKPTKQTTANPGSSNEHELGMGSTTKPS